MKTLAGGSKSHQEDRSIYAIRKEQEREFCHNCGKQHPRGKCLPPGRINKAKKSTLCFLSGPIRNDSTRHADKKKYVRIRFRGKTLIRLSTIKFTKHYNPTSNLDLVRGVRNQLLAVYVSH